MQKLCGSLTSSRCILRSVLTIVLKVKIAGTKSGYQSIKHFLQMKRKPESYEESGQSENCANVPPRSELARISKGLIISPTGFAPVTNPDSDEDGGLSIFDTLCGHEVLHDPQDQLENVSIPMRPDRVAGLSTTNSLGRYTALCPPTIRHTPFKDGKLLYPFLVIEAKPEKDNAGFESVEAQTAFPVRRFLKLQENLRISRGVDLDPLVWFFAFRGEEWRLYAGTFQNSTVVRLSPSLITSSRILMDSDTNQDDT